MCSSRALRTAAAGEEDGVPRRAKNLPGRFQDECVLLQVRAVKKSENHLGAASLPEEVQGPVHLNLFAQEKHFFFLRRFPCLYFIAFDEDDPVLVPAMTFTGSAEVVRYLGGDPVLLDVDYGTRMVTPEILDRALSEDNGIKAAVVVHFGGQAAPLLDRNGRRGILSVCRRHGVRLIEDAAHAFPAYCLADQPSPVREDQGNCGSGSRRDGTAKNGTTERETKKGLQRVAVGGIGDATCFSFYANKTITTGEGGMVTTDDPDVAERVRVMRIHGIDRDVWNRYTEKKEDWEYDVIAPGFKYNMPDANAAIGLAQLEQAEKMRQARQRVASFYMENLSNVACMDLPEIKAPFEDHAWHLFCIVLKPEAPISRNKFIEKMAQAGIGTSVHYKPLYRMTYYRERYRLSPESFPNSERIWQGTVSLPIYPTLTEEELEYIVKTIRGLLC